ncbi:rhomboid family intramembrane serine protease [Afipia sp. P52-10]|uniref:rhomboid family intramembrane serine protease n=1 Tax=Afipia sp. P52-10 TaxID=1429916 RepID=UPI0004AE7ACE|nr:rhomboid family intramembrane serine protease [Afipia sp. P52-10]
MFIVSLRRTGNASQRRKPAYATWTLIALTIAVYLLQASLGDNEASELMLRFGVTPEIVNGGERPYGGFPVWLTPLTALFLHGSWDHLTGNMLYLWMFGDDVEDALGPLRFVLLYLLSGICGAIGYVVLDGGATLPLLGASGCVAGVVAAYLMLKPCEGVHLALPRFDVHLSTSWAVGSWGLLQLFQVLWHREDEAFAMLAHGGGLLGGAAAFILLSPRGLKLFQCLSARNDRPPDTAA